MSVGPFVRSPLLLVDDAVRQLSAPPINFLLDPIELGLAPRDHGVSVEQARQELARRDTSIEVKNQAWELLVTRTQANNPVWALAAVGIALPGLRRLSGELASGHLDCRADLDAEILTGFLTAVADARTRAQRRFPALIRLTRRCGLAWLRERRNAPTALGDIEALQLTAVAGGDREHAPQRTEFVDIGGGSGPVGHPDVVLSDAVAAGILTESEAEIIAATRLERRPLREVAAAQGVSSNTLWMRRDRAEKRLITALAHAVAADDGDRASDPTHAHLLATIPLGHRLHPATSRRPHPRSASALSAPARKPRTTPSTPRSATVGVAVSGAGADIGTAGEKSGRGRSGHTPSVAGQRDVGDTSNAPARPPHGRSTRDGHPPGHPLLSGVDRAGQPTIAGRTVRATHTQAAPRFTPDTVSTPGDHTGPQHRGAPRVASFIVFVAVLSGSMVPGTELRGLHPVSAVRRWVAVTTGSALRAPAGPPGMSLESPSRQSRLNAAGSPPRSSADERSGRPVRTAVLAQAGPDGTAQLTRVLNNIRTWLMGLLITLATLLLTVGGVRYLCAGGDPGEVEAAKRAVKSAAIGYALAALAPALVAILRNLVGT